VTSGFVRVLLVVSGVMILVFTGEAIWDWVRLGMPALATQGWAGVNNAKMVDILSPIARGYNNILAMLLATIGIAIPLTANMHTPKLIDMFLRDRLNIVVLTVGAVGAANVLWVDFIIGPQFAPLWSYRIAVLGALAGWAVLIPYFFYVVRFLDPSNILARLRTDVERSILRVQTGRLDAVRGRAQAAEYVAEIGAVALKAVDRADRGVAVEAIGALLSLLDFHGARKASLPRLWFEVGQPDFVGLSTDAIELVNTGRVWFEMKALNQAQLVYQQSFPRVTDLVSSVSDAVRIAAVHAAQRGDDAARELCIRFFNSFLREAIHRRDVRSIYDIFHCYRLLARDLRDFPETVLKIGRYFGTYSRAAAEACLDFIPQLAAFDLAFIVRRAYEAGSSAAPPLLAEVLAMPHTRKGVAVSLVVKAKLVLGGFFDSLGMTREAEQVAANLADVPAEDLREAGDDLLAAQRFYHEVTDRQVNFEYLPPERRAHVKTFIARLVGDRLAVSEPESS
jgi:Predicted membrane protein (DUF2254)